MKYKIVADSSSNLTSLKQVPFSSVPLHIIVGDRNFVDDENVDINDMQETLKAYKGTTSTSCPSPQDWINAFGDAEAVFCNDYKCIIRFLQLGKYCGTDV